MNNLSGFILALCITFCACSPPPALTRISGNGLGTYYTITMADKNTVTSSQIDSVISELSLTASIFNPNSLVSKINRNETDTLNQLLKEILEISRQVCEETEGAFDFTVGALVNLWGFGKDAPTVEKQRTASLLEKTLETVGYKKIRIGDNRIIKENPDTQLNFNAIAKGYCVDKVTAFLKSQGMENFVVEIGGEITVCGERAPNKKCVWVFKNLP